MIALLLAAGQFTVQIEHTRYPLARPICEAKGWPNPAQASTEKDARDLAHNRLYRLQQCGFVTAREFSTERTRIYATKFTPGCKSAPLHFGTADVRVRVTWWGPEC